MSVSEDDSKPFGNILTFLGSTGNEHLVILSLGEMSDDSLNFLGTRAITSGRLRLCKMLVAGSIVSQFLDLHVVLFSQSFHWSVIISQKLARYTDSLLTVWRWPLAMEFLGPIRNRHTWR
jgi:hypothetical protein